MALSCSTLAASAIACRSTRRGEGFLLAGSGQACNRCTRAALRRRQPRWQPTQAALLDPPPFDPSKLSVEYLPGTSSGSRTLTGRRYTLTHNDVTGSLQLAIGLEYNRRQLDGWYTRILRDEILAEWQDTAPPAARSSMSSSMSGSMSGSVLDNVDGDCLLGGFVSDRGALPSLHVYCHVSGEELWPAPPQLRSFIFQREMALVLDTISHAERVALETTPRLRTAPVYVHLRSDVPALDRVVEWGVLGDRATWRTSRSSMMRSLLSSVMGTMDEAEATATDGSSGTWSRSAFSDAAAAGSWEGGAPGGAACGARWEGGGWDGSASWDVGDGGLRVPAGETQHFSQQQQQQQQQQQRLPPEACDTGSGDGLAAVTIATAGPLAASSAVPGAADVVAGGSTGASSAAGNAVSSSLGAANGAVSLMTDAPSWVSVNPVAADGRQRLPAPVSAVAASSRSLSNGSSR